jgi:hypothetical protein
MATRVSSMLHDAGWTGTWVVECSVAVTNLVWTLINAVCNRNWQATVPLQVHQPAL